MVGKDEDKEEYDVRLSCGCSKAQHWPLSKTKDNDEKNPEKGFRQGVETMEWKIQCMEERGGRMIERANGAVTRRAPKMKITA